MLSVPFISLAPATGAVVPTTTLTSTTAPLTVIILSLSPWLPPRVTSLPLVITMPSLPAPRSSLPTAKPLPTCCLTLIPATSLPAKEASLLPTKRLLSALAVTLSSSVSLPNLSAASPTLISVFTSPVSSLTSSPFIVSLVPPCIFNLSCAELA